jgi:DNA-binding Xre family transcriptional regulator
MRDRTTYPPKAQTKIAEILRNRNLSLSDLYFMIGWKKLPNIGIDRLSRIVNGKTTNPTLQTMKTICSALETTLDETF